MSLYPDPILTGREERFSAEKMLMHAASRGGEVTITVDDIERDRRTTYKGRLVEASTDVMDGLMRLTFHASGEACVQPGMHYRGEAMDVAMPENDEPEEQDINMNAIVHYNTRNRMVDVSIEVGKDVFLNPDNEEVERRIGEEMPVYISMPEEILAAIKSSAPRVI